jgi:chromosomal replication initiator protein
MNLSIYAIPGVKTAGIQLFIKHPSQNEIDMLKAIVADHYSITIERINAKTRKQEVVLARYAFAYLLRKYTKLSLLLIGVNMGGRDHTTAIHAIQTFQNYLDTEPETKMNFSCLIEKISPALSRNVEARSFTS